ncbi:MAG: TRIC cation channel family protein [Oscillospiraceae bacterium]|nr:TRIC cation channel family protein [Oscillospiraceae bacterium]
MKKTYLLPEATEKPFQGKDRFMKDKKKRYVKLDTDTAGTMGYWDKKCVPMYALELQLDGAKLTCLLNRQEEKKGTMKKPRDKLLSLGIGLAVFAVLYLILGVLVGLHPILSLMISALVGILTAVGVLLIFFFEYRSFYRLLDQYLKKTLRAKPGR